MYHELAEQASIDKLPQGTRDLLEESDSHGLIADGTRLPFYGVVRLPKRLRDVKTEIFVVSDISKYAILGRSFLMAHQRYVVPAARGLHRRLAPDLYEKTRAAVAQQISGSARHGGASPD